MATSAGSRIDFKAKYSIDEIRKAFSKASIKELPGDRITVTDKKPGSTYSLHCTFFRGNAVEIQLDYNLNRGGRDPHATVDAAAIAAELIDRFGQPDAEPFDGRMSWDFPSVSRHIYYWHSNNGITDSLSVTFSKPGWQAEASSARSKLERESLKQKDIGF